MKKKKAAVQGNDEERLELELIPTQLLYAHGPLIAGWAVFEITRKDILLSNNLTE